LNVPAGWMGTIEPMIVRLNGVWRGTYLDVNGVGYDIDVLNPPRAGEGAELYIRSVWREGNGYSLYGFANEAERGCFDAMCKVARVGPAAAMSVLRTHGLGRAVASIVAKDPAMLHKTPGVGKKTAELIVGYTNLDEELIRIGTEDGSGPDEIVEALVSLGYGEKESRESARKARDGGAEGDEVLREALRIVREIK
jgi:Holliday junction DNA helicase RuvA